MRNIEDSGRKPQKTFGRKFGEPSLHERRLLRAALTRRLAARIESNRLEAARLRLRGEHDAARAVEAAAERLAVLARRDDPLAGPGAA